MSDIGLGDEGTHATDFSAGFYLHFQREKNEITSRLEALKAKSSATDINTSEYASISSKISVLRKEIVDSTPYLPTYDQGKYEQQIKVLEDSLSSHRTPKSKFAFKRKPVAQSSQLPIVELSSTVPSPSRSGLHGTAPSTTNLTLSSRAAALLTLSSLVHSADTSLPNSGLPRNSDVTLTELDDCIINFFPSMTDQGTSTTTEQTLAITALHARDLRRVVLAMPLIEGSVLLHNIHNSIVVIGCHQFRMHDSTNTTVLLHVLSNPIIERSQGIRFGAYPDALHRVMSKAFLKRPSKHNMVQDFDWIKPSASPNWSVLGSSANLQERIVQVTNSGEQERQLESGILDEILRHAGPSEE